MSRNLLASAQTYLETEQSLKIAHLVRLELSSSTDDVKVYAYLTDYMGNIDWNSQTYEAGKVTKIGDVKQSQGLSNYKLSIDIAGEFQTELDRGLVENLEESYVGKDIEVLRAYIDTDGSIIPFDADDNGPMKYFIGDISDISITEGVVSGTSTVKWQCAGKFADFQKVNGRITDDTSHRGLVNNNGTFEGSDGAKKTSHQTDTGFQHANQSIHVASKYLTTETRYKMKKRHFWQSSKMVEYEEEVEKEVELGVDMSAKFLPKVYGVRKVPGIPVFIDSLISEPSHVYIVYAFAEGEIDSFLNFYLDGDSVICSSEVEGQGTVCLGNQANGDTLSAYMSTTAAAELEQIEREAYRPSQEEASREGIPYMPIPYKVPVQGIARTLGTTHTIDPGGTNEVVSYFTVRNEKGVKEITTFHGKDNQNASEELVNIAAAGDFALQARWSDNTGRPASEYWDASCKLLDTAYVVMKIAITEEETDLPKIDAVVSGSLVSTYDAVGNETTDQYTLNPVWHTLAYMRDKVCGGGMEEAEINLKSFYDIAQKQDVVTDSYENDYLTYWRYVGWKTTPQDQGLGDDPQKTLMQCNTLIKTEDTVTKNLQALLGQFDATLNILGGKYHLSVETDDAPIAHIDVMDIKGSIKTKDLSNKSKWNSIQASIVDPAMAWGTNQVNFFNSEYLKKDNGVKKKGNIQFRHLTNYYTARAWAKIQLAKSRYSRELTFTTYYKFTNLHPNANVTFSYPRFGYTVASPGTFRVKSTTLKSNGLVSLVLEDYDNSIYDTELSDDQSGERTPSSVPIMPPTGVEYVSLPDARFSVGDDNTQGIMVWDISTDPTILRYEVRDWLDLSSDQGVPYDRVISDSGTNKNYILVSGLDANTEYDFKVRTIAKNGKGSKYAVYTHTTSSNVSPISFSPVTNFKATNAAEGYFDGGDLSMSWDAHTDPNVVDYDIAVWDATGTTTIYRLESVVGTTYTYSISKNKDDYAAENAGAVGAYRSFVIKIRATDGGTVVSEWTNLI